MADGELRLINTTVASNVASFQFASHPGGWGGGLFVDKASKAVVVHSTIVLNSARFAAGIASNNTVTMLASLLSGNLGALKGGDCGDTGRIESKGWNHAVDLQLRIDEGRLTHLIDGLSEPNPSIVLRPSSISPSPCYCPRQPAFLLSDYDMEHSR
jgi:hypothetical protein